MVLKRCRRRFGRAILVRPSIAPQRAGRLLLKKNRIVFFGDDFPRGYILDGFLDAPTSKPAVGSVGTKIHNLTFRMAILDAAIGPEAFNAFGVNDADPHQETISSTEARSDAEAMPFFGNTPKTATATSEVALDGEVSSVTVRIGLTYR